MCPLLPYEKRPGTEFVYAFPQALFAVGPSFCPALDSGQAESFGLSLGS